MQINQDTQHRILRALESLNSAIFSRKLDDTLRLFTNNDDTVVVGSEAGEVAQGRYAVQAFFEKVFASALRYSFRWTERFINVQGDVAWLFANGVIISSSEAGLHEHPYRVTLVFLRQGSEWLCTHYHGSEPAG